MILDNRTRYRSADLERVILRALEEAEITAHARDRVLVNYGRARSYSGWCYFGHVTPPKGKSGKRAPRMVLRLPDPAGVKPRPAVARMAAGRCPRHDVPAPPDPATTLDDPRFPPGSKILRCPRGCRFVQSTTTAPQARAAVAFDVPLFVWLVRHEVAHWRGLTHKQMSPYMLHRHLWEGADRILPPWAGDMTVALEDAPPAPSRKPPPDREAEREKRAAHARAMLARAERRAKLAATLVKKWARRVSAGERAIERAASRGSK